MGAIAVRKTSVSAPPKGNFVNKDDLAAFVVDGEVVMADTSSYKLDGQVLAVVSRWDGSIGLEYAKTADGRFWAGERSGFHGATRGNQIISLGCVILGRVIEAQ